MSVGTHAVQSKFSGLRINPLWGREVRTSVRTFLFLYKSLILVVTFYPHSLGKGTIFHRFSKRVKTEKWTNKPKSAKGKCPIKTTPTRELIKAFPCFVSLSFENRLSKRESSFIGSSKTKNAFLLCSVFQTTAYWRNIFLEDGLCQVIGKGVPFLVQRIFLTVSLPFESDESEGPNRRDSPS